METKTLLIGLAGFILGGLIVSVAATNMDKPPATSATMTMNEMSGTLNGKTGDAYDKAFIASMIGHHQGALDMAKQSAASAKHEEIKKLSNNIVTAQEQEIAQMKQWQKEWGYSTASAGTTHMSH